MTYRRHEDDEAEYAHDEADLRAAGYRRTRDPRGGTSLVRRYSAGNPTEDADR